MNEQSLQANKTVRRYKDQKVVLETIQELGNATLKDVAHLMGKQLNQISGRFTELKRTGEIEPTGETKDGCMIYKLKDYQGWLF